jgi:tetratricopeptide (TPR) repeat protein
MTNDQSIMTYNDAEQRLVAIGKELEKDLNNSEAWVAKGDILCSLGLHELANQCYNRSLAINPDNVLTWVSKSIALNKLGKHDEVEIALAKAKELGHKGV